MRALVTGGGGFVGRHLTEACERAGDEVVGVSRSAGVDLADPEAARSAVAAARPDVVYHLAAQAHVVRSWRDPAGTIGLNLDLTLNVLEAVRLEAPQAVVVLASSGEVYGPPAALPVDEHAPLRPQNPYAVSKAASDLLAGFYADAHGVRVVRARAFNHAGPGQEPVYAIASFTRQVAAGLESGGGAVRVVTGNAETRRDYTDVRDVVRAYRALALPEHAGAVLNVCSGRSWSAADLLRLLADGTGAEIEHVIDPALLRPNEVMEVRGDRRALGAATGWEPQIDLERTLTDTVAWWREEIRSGRAEGVPAHE